MLYERNLIFYDAESGSLWSQLLSEAVTGPLAGKSLKILPAENTTWQAWTRLHPDTQILSFKTGLHRDYKEDPYASYPLPRRLALLVTFGGSVKIYPFSELKKGPSPLIDKVEGRQIRISYDSGTKTAQVEDKPAEANTFVAFFDDLKVFYPHAQIYRHPHR